MSWSRFAAATAQPDSIAIVSEEGVATYAELWEASGKVAGALLGGATDLAEARVAFLVPSGFRYVATQWGVWRAGGVAVPLCLLHPKPELEYVIEDSGASVLVAAPECADRLRPIAEERCLRFVDTEALLAGNPRSLPEIASDRRAMMLYTSGTTGRPKGVVTTHANIDAQAASLIEAWEWMTEDVILHTLPLHHIHGIVNALTCAMAVGATCVFLPKFDADAVWDRIAEGGITLFMGVPTMYSKLIAAWEAAPEARRAVLSEAASRLRLFVSGSAALPVPVLDRWRAITGHTLLERYGMTEIGMALSNPLRGERVPGSVGMPLPNVEVRLVGEGGALVPDGTPGEIEVRGPTVFLEYWNRPEETASAFRDGWFRTGDIAVREGGRYRILGRDSVDIIKTGGYKVSALEIESVLRGHPSIAECAVVGVPDPEWGERVGVALVPKGEEPLTLEALRSWAKERLAVYKVPTRMLAVDALPRNAMGKVTKPAVTALFTSSENETPESPRHSTC